MDTETGEFTYEMDRETGEKRPWTSFQNIETGEDEQKDAKKPFRINNHATRPGYRYPTKPLKTSETLSQFIMAVVFLIPTAVIFTPLLGLFVLTSACFLHRWSHRQNRRLEKKGDESVYYLSPLHALSKEFCHLCIEESTMIKISKGSRLVKSVAS